MGNEGRGQVGVDSSQQKGGKGKDPQNKKTLNKHSLQGENVDR